MEPEDVDRFRQKKPKIPISSLRSHQEVTGEVVDVRSYGVIVDVGANRRGLLHIQKVADLYGRFIEKERGLVSAGLEKGAKVRLLVESNQKKRLYLDFTDDVKKEAESERARLGSFVSSKPTNTGNSDPFSTEELAAWEEYAESLDSKSGKVSLDAPPEDDSFGEDEDYDEDYDDDYDEDRDIEDSLGLGTY